MAGHLQWGTISLVEAAREVDAVGETCASNVSWMVGACLCVSFGLERGAESDAGVSQAGVDGDAGGLC